MLLYSKAKYCKHCVSPAKLCQSLDSRKWDNQLIICTLNVEHNLANEVLHRMQRIVHPNDLN